MEVILYCCSSASFPTVFTYHFHINQKSYQGNNVRCLGTAESHLECDTLLCTTTKVLQEKLENLIHENNQSYHIYNMPA